MNKLHILGAAFFATLLLSACKKEKEEDPVTEGVVRVQMKAMWGDQPFSIGSTYADPFNRDLLVETFRAYIHDLHLVREDNSTVQLSEIALVDFDEGLTIERTVAAGRYKAIGFGTGVPESLNTGQDPAQYPNEHPLSVQSSAGMFWTWNSGYIFVKYEGKVTLEGSENELTDPFGFHIGTDNFYRSFALAKTFDIDEARTDLTIVFDVQKFLTGSDDTIDLSQDFITHTMSNMPLATRFTDLFVDAVTLQ
jgi:hypothetical protein